MLTYTIQNYLKQNHIPYQRIEHSRTYTAQQTARVAHLPPDRLAKTVIVNVDDDMVMVVLSANERIDLQGLKEYLEADNIELVSEEEFQERFPDCELGAIPPLGDLYQMPVVVSQTVASRESLTFCAGTHTDLVTIPYSYFKSLVRPIVATFACH